MGSTATNETGTHERNVSRIFKKIPSILKLRITFLVKHYIFLFNKKNVIIKYKSPLKAFQNRFTQGTLRKLLIHTLY